MSNAENKNLFIIDDVFPFEISAFRYQEFSSLLENIPNSNILTTGESIKQVGGSSIGEIIDEYAVKYPILSKKILKKLPKDIADYKLLYCNFLFNAYTYLLPISEQFHIPFVFTLYPGGRFSLNETNSDNMLKKIFSSAYFKKVIVTQQITYDYLIKNELCSPNKIEFIFGGIIINEKITKNYNQKQYYNIDKDNLDICFVAHKYTNDGSDKGYDIFVEVAKKLSNKYNNINFHVVGNFDRNVLDVSSIKNIKFYGVRPQDWFDDFYQDKDIILSPNIAGKIKAGSFDGFPTSCVMEAGLRKVGMFCTDFLNSNNNRFKVDKDIIIIDRDINSICKKIEYFYNNPSELKKICINGYNKIKSIYCYESQITPRINIVKYEIENSQFKKKLNKRWAFISIFNFKIKFRCFLNTFYHTISNIKPLMKIKSQIRNRRFLWNQKGY